MSLLEAVTVFVTLKVEGRQLNSLEKAQLKQSIPQYIDDDQLYEQENLILQILDEYYFAPPEQMEKILLNLHEMIEQHLLRLRVKNLHHSFETRLEAEEQNLQDL